jgi:hypothetical protein
VARIFEVDPKTVLPWLAEVAEHLEALSHHFLHDLHVSQVQLDALVAVLRAVKAGEVSDVEAIQRLSRSPHGVWVAIDPSTELLLALDVGARTRAMAQRLVHQVAPRVAPGYVPLFLPDGFKASVTARLTPVGRWVQPPRRQAKGSTPKPRWMPLPELLYAQVVTSYRRRRIVRVRPRGVFGPRAVVQHMRAARGWPINTAFVARVNLTIRQHMAAVGRRVVTLCNGEAG